MRKKRKDVYRKIKMKDAISTMDAGFWIKHNFDTVSYTDPNALKEGYPNYNIFARLTDDQLQIFKEKFGDKVKSIQ